MHTMLTMTSLIKTLTLAYTTHVSQLYMYTAWVDPLAFVRGSVKLQPTNRMEVPSEVHGHSLIRDLGTKSTRS